MIEQAINVIEKDKLEEYALRLHQPQEAVYVIVDNRNLYFTSVKDKEKPFSKIKNGMLFVSRETTKGELEIMRMEPVVNFNRYL